MKRLIRFGSVGLVIAGAIAIGGEAFAQNYRQQSADGSHNLFITGTPRTQVPVTISGGGSVVTKAFKANGCGHIVIPMAANYVGLSVDGNARDVTNAFTQTAIAPPTCLGTTSSTLPATHDTNSSVGTWNLGDGKVLVTVPVAASAPNGRMVDATYTDSAPKSRFVTLSACGLGKISKLNLAADLSINNGATVGFSSIADISSPLRCKSDAVMGTVTDFDFGSDPLPAVYKDAAKNVFISGLPSGGSVVVAVSSQTTSKSVTSDRCGGLTIGSTSNPQTAPFAIGSDTIDPATLSVGLKPSCKKQTDSSYAYDVAPTANIKTSSGQVFVKSTTSYPTGFGDRRILTVTSTGGATRTIKADLCGIATLRASSGVPASEAFNYNGTDYTVTALPVKDTICANTGTSASPNYSLYRALP